MKIIVLLFMIFFHVVDDYYLQGCLAKLKQKAFWENDTVGKSPLYRFDYLMALFMHAFSWTFSIFVPIFVYYLMHPGIPQMTAFELSILFGMNVFVHAFVDNEKCNKFRINLIEDQLSHLVQIAITFLYFIVLR